MVGYHRETHHFREEKSTKELTVPQHTRFILPLTSPDKIHRCAAWAVFFFYGHLSGRRPLHLANARPFGRSKAPLGLLLLRKRELALAGGAGSSHPQQRETERSRRGTPCCTYRYRLWLLAGCVLRGAPCFCFALNLLTRDFLLHSEDISPVRRSGSVQHTPAGHCR